LGFLDRQKKKTYNMSGCCGDNKVELQGLVVDGNGSSKSARSRKRIYKIVLLGDSSVGKTCLLRRFVRSEYSTEYKATIGADFLSKEVTLDDGCKVQLQIWDTAGQERFHSLGVVFYRGADGCGFVCDVGNESSLESVDRWRREFGNAETRPTPADASKVDEVAHVPCMLLANKCDLQADLRVVSNGSLQKWSSARNMPFYETSALTAQGVEEAFQSLAKRLVAGDTD